MKWLREVVSRKKPEIQPQDWILRNYNSPSHNALSFKQFLVQKSINGIEHPSYSHDLAPNEFWLFTKIKSTLKGWIFQDIEDIKNVTTTLKVIPQQWFQNCSQQWQHLFAKHIAAQGKYFEVDSSQ